MRNLGALGKNLASPPISRLTDRVSVDELEKINDLLLYDGVKQMRLMLDTARKTGNYELGLKIVKSIVDVGKLLTKRKEIESKYEKESDFDFDEDLLIGEIDDGEES